MLEGVGSWQSGWALLTCSLALVFLACQDLAHCLALVFFLFSLAILMLSNLASSNFFSYFIPPSLHALRRRYVFCINLVIVLGEKVKFFLHGEEIKVKNIEGRTFVPSSIHLHLLLAIFIGSSPICMLFFFFLLLFHSSHSDCSKWSLLLSGACNNGGSEGWGLLLCLYGGLILCLRLLFLFCGTCHSLLQGLHLFFTSIFLMIFLFFNGNDLFFCQTLEKCYSMPRMVLRLHTLEEAPSTSWHLSLIRYPC